jgi:hypothetical protein
MKNRAKVLYQQSLLFLEEMGFLRYMSMTSPPQADLPKLFRDAPNSAHSALERYKSLLDDPLH